MKEVKKLFLRIFLVVEIVGLTGWYFASNSGIRALRYAEKNNKELVDEINQLEKETTRLKEELIERQKSSFYKEKIAREDLQMARPNETIYLMAQD